MELIYQALDIITGKEAKDWDAFLTVIKGRQGIASHDPSAMISRDVAAAAAWALLVAADAAGVSADELLTRAERLYQQADRAHPV